MSAFEWLMFTGVSVVSFLFAVSVRKLSLATPRETTNEQLEWLPQLEIGTLSNDESQLKEHDKIDLWMHRIVSQSGTGLNLESFLVINLIVSFIALGVVLELQCDIFFAIAAGMLSFLLGLAVVVAAFTGRRKKFLVQFPVAVDLIACSVAAGQSFREAIDTATDSLEEPASSELLRCSRELSMGMSVSQCVQRLARRIPAIDVKIFAHTISVHEEMGGQLGTTLKRMANVIRQRSDDIQKAKAATSLGKFAAVMICSIGVIAVLYLVVFEPDYIGKLFDSQLGQRMALYAMISEIIGVASVFLVLQTEG